ncbi:type VI secretion system lysozyme-like protein [Methylomagnum ishizawai]|uniref:Type VI secretion system lysozyme-like protein n=1 Tax=Methylomagnum ishizawai TaxID=1760988 RepID=A0A1Y6D407_9GAMM|nr:type VI secretion system baseplate subunit TssE [Methylomagnum ishizawai]SMF94695.1 type VI secretion system lysozyme-like protein [Methylomagnum ishizawai]
MDLLRKLGNNTATGERDLVLGIVDNLNHVLNSKRGFSYFLEDFGISDYNHLSSREDIARAVMREVRENIEAFEPRIKLVDIVEIPDASLFRLSFRINCIVRENSRSLSMIFDPRIERYWVNAE